MSAWAKPGVKCVCVDGGDTGFGQGHAPLNGYPVAGTVYTVGRVITDHPFGRLTVTLIELPNPAKMDGSDYGFWIARFRPLITLDQDIALFAHHLDGVGVPA